MTTDQMRATPNGYRVERRVSGECTMGDGSKQPRTTAYIYDEAGRLVTAVAMNATTFACPKPWGHGQGIAATDAQVIIAVLGDENIFTGAPSMPEHHDKVLPND